MLAYNLSRDHKPDLEAEKDRILKAGGFVQYGRVNGSLNLARPFGVELCDDDEFLVIACDGIWIVEYMLMNMRRGSSLYLQGSSLYLQDMKEDETEAEAGLECLHQSAKKELQVYLNVDGPLKDSNESSTQNYDGIAIRIGKVLDVVKRLENTQSLYGQKANTPHEDGGQGEDEEHEGELGSDEDDDAEGDEEESGT
ncbi:unnamed protein product [Camellia sinensis]